MIPSQPTFIPTPFAQSGNKNSIPASNDGTSGLASYSLGFPQITETPLSIGGIPPKRKDFNGILNALSTFAFFAQSGGVFTYSNTANYAKPAVVIYNNVFYFCKKQNGPDSTNGVMAPTDTEYWTPFIDYLLNNLTVGTPIGTIIMWASSNNPQDGGVWLDCDGASFNTTTYAELYSILGSGNVPNLKGLFPRCVGSQDLSVTINGTTTTQTFNGGSVGTKSADAIRNITGDVGYFRSGSYQTVSGAFTNQSGGNSWTGGDQISGIVASFNASNVVPVASENKPASVSLRFLIKAL